MSVPVTRIYRAMGRSTAATGATASGAGGVAARSFVFPDAPHALKKAALVTTAATRTSLTRLALLRLIGHSRRLRAPVRIPIAFRLPGTRGKPFCGAGLLIEGPR